MLRVWYIASPMCSHAWRTLYPTCSGALCPTGSRAWIAIRFMWTSDSRVLFPKYFRDSCATCLIGSRLLQTSCFICSCVSRASCLTCSIILCVRHFRDTCTSLTSAYGKPNINMLLRRNLPIDSGVGQWSHSLMIQLHCLWAKSNDRMPGQFECDVTWFCFYFEFIRLHARCSCCSIVC